MLKQLINFTFLLLVLLLFSCSKRNFTGKAAYQFNSKTGIPDYSDLHYWAAHPFKDDPSDSIPKPLRALYKKDSTADVFFIHPTTLVDPEIIKWNAQIDDMPLNIKTDYSTILYQASAFNEQCRIFSPRYRQAHYQSFFIPDSISKPYFDLAYNDIKTAFEYYLKYYNNGRPIIIASHSQGTVHAVRLLKDYFENKPLIGQLICAYLIGMPLQQSNFSVLEPCKDSRKTGCFVGWRTYKKGYLEQKYIAKETFSSIVINPLTWTNNPEHASAKLNKGAILKNFNKISRHAVSCEIHNNILWSSKPKFFGNIFLTKKNYHIADINLFYMNIRENVKERITEYYRKTTNRI